MLLCCCVVRRCWYLRCPAGEAGLFPARLADTAARFSWPAFFLGFVFSRVFLLRAAALLGCLGMTSRCDVMGVCEIPNHRMGMRHPKPQEKRHEAKGRMLTRASPTQSLVDLTPALRKPPPRRSTLAKPPRRRSAFRKFQRSPAVSPRGQTAASVRAVLLRVRGYQGSWETVGAVAR